MCKPKHTKALNKFCYVDKLSSHRNHNSPSEMFLEGLPIKISLSTRRLCSLR